jgi:hypothetical protein
VKQIRQSEDRWALVFGYENKTDGARRHFIICEADFGPALFRTRAAARYYASKYFGHNKDQSNLRAEPHVSKPPSAVRVRVTIEEIARKP